MPRDPDDGSGPLDVDAAFAEIVARWGDDAPTRPGPGEDSPEEAQDQTPRHLHDEDHEDHRDHADDRDEPPAAEDRVRLVKPALPPAPKEDVPTEDTSDVPPPEWFAAPRPRDTERSRDEDPPELRALSEERFVPAEPGPLPRDVVGWAAWVAVVGAPLFLLVVALGWHDVPRLLTAITAGVFVAGFATLVIRLPSSRDDDDDDGAVV